MTVFPWLQFHLQRLLSQMWQERLNAERGKVEQACHEALTKSMSVWFPTQRQDTFCIFLYHCVTVHDRAECKLYLYAGAMYARSE